MRRAQHQDGRWHRQQDVQIERAGLAAPDQGGRARLPRHHPFAKLLGQDAAALD